MEFLLPFLNPENMANNAAMFGPTIATAAQQAFNEFTAAAAAGLRTGEAPNGFNCSQNGAPAPGTSEQARARQAEECGQRHGTGFNLEEFMGTAAAVVASLADQYQKAQELAAANSSQSQRCPMPQNGCSLSQNCTRMTENGFEIRFDVGQFKPEDLNVKVVDNFIVLEGIHEEREDEQGFVSRQFKRRFTIPEGIDADKINCAFTPNGHLVISAPKIVEKQVSKEKVIPIQVGQNVSAPSVGATPVTPANTPATETNVNGSAQEPMTL